MKRTLFIGVIAALFLLTPFTGVPVFGQSANPEPPVEETSLDAPGVATAETPEGGEPAVAESRSPVEIAGEAYARGDWETAIAQYRAMLAEGYADPALYYNLGTAYARAGRKGEAVWMLLKAGRLDPRDPSIRRNLSLVAPDLENQRALFPFPPLEALYRGLRMNEWAGIGGGATVLAALAFALSLTRGPVDRRRRWLRRIAGMAAIVALTGHGFAAARYYDETWVAHGVVTDPDTQPRSAPSEASDIYAFTLPPGTLVRLQNAGAEGWVKAIYGGRNEVFIRDDQYERL